MRRWWLRLLHRLGIRRSVWFIVENMTEAENTAIDIYNGWQFGLYDRNKALTLFTDEQLRDPQAKFWYDRIWRHEDMSK